jgi:4-amino-4-deoxy-L-arabinose transferase-like glycosyltransferase
MTPENRRFTIYDALILVLMLLAVLLLRFPSFLQPWGSDQGVYGYIAKGILDGKVPYRDMYSSTGYGIFFTYALLFKLFGTKMVSLHIGDFIAFYAIVVLVYLLSRLLYGRECAIIAAAFAALFGSGQAFSGLYDMKGAWGTYWQLAQREVFMTPLIAAGVYLSLLANRRNGWRSYVWVGVLIGIAIILKITAIAMLGLLIMYVVVDGLIGHRDGGSGLILMRIASLIAGAVVVQLPFLYYFWSHDSLSTMYNAVFVHTSVYAKLSRGNILANAFQGNAYIFNENLPLWLFSLSSIIYMMMRERSRENYLVIVWTLGSLLMVWGQGKFFGYHYILLVAPFAVLSAFAVIRILKTRMTWTESLRAAGKSVVQIFIWVMLLSHIAVFAIKNYEYYKWNAMYLAGSISQDEYYEVFNEFPLHLYSFRADYEVAKYLKKHADRGDALRTINGGGDTIIHFLSGLELSTRFTSTWYLFNKGLYDEPVTERLRKEFIDEIEKEKPKYILLVYFSLDEFFQDFKGDKYDDMMRLLNFVKNDYVIERSFKDRRTLYRRI